MLDRTPQARRDKRPRQQEHDGVNHEPLQPLATGAGIRHARLVTAGTLGGAGALVTLNIRDYERFGLPLLDPQVVAENSEAVASASRSG